MSESEVIERGGARGMDSFRRVAALCAAAAGGCGDAPGIVPVMGRIGIALPTEFPATVTVGALPGMTLPAELRCRDFSVRVEYTDVDGTDFPLPYELPPVPAGVQSIVAVLVSDSPEGLTLGGSTLVTVTEGGSILLAGDPQSEVAVTLEGGIQYACP